MCALL